MVAEEVRGGENWGETLLARLETADFCLGETGSPWRAPTKQCHEWGKQESGILVETTDYGDLDKVAGRELVP